MPPDIIYRNALYLGSIPLDTDASCREQFVRNKLESIQSFSWYKPIMLCISTSGVKVCDPTCKTVFMAHALRRISYATSDISSPKFVFLAREANIENPSQFCHMFATDTQSKAEELNRIMGDAFKLALAKQRLAKKLNYTDDADGHMDSEDVDLPTLSSLHAPVAETPSPHQFSTEIKDLCDLNLPPPPSSPPPPFEDEEGVEVESVPLCHTNGNAPSAFLHPTSDFQDQLSVQNHLVSDSSQTKTTLQPSTCITMNTTKTSSSDDSGSQKQKKCANARNSLADFSTPPPATRASTFFASVSPSSHRPSTNSVFNFDLTTVGKYTTCPVVALKTYLDGLALKEKPTPPQRPKPEETPSRFRLRGPRTRIGRETAAAESQKARRSMLLGRGDRPLSQIICLDSALLLNNSPSFASQQQPRSEELLMPSDTPSAGSSGGSQENQFFTADSTNHIRMNSLRRVSDNGGFQGDNHHQPGGGLMAPLHESEISPLGGVRRLAEVCPVPHLPSIASDSILLPSNDSFFPALPPDVYSSSPNMVPIAEARQKYQNNNNTEHDREPWRPSHPSAFTNATDIRKKKPMPQLPSHAVLNCGNSCSTGVHHNNGCHHPSNQFDFISHPRFPLDSEGIRLHRLQKQPSDWGSSAATGRGPPSSSTETPTPTATPTPTPTPIPGNFPTSTGSRREKDIVGSAYNTPWFQPMLPRNVALELLCHEEVGAFLVRDSVTHPGCWALSVRVPEHVNSFGTMHYLIQHSELGVKLQGLDKEWPSLEALITHLTVMPEMLPCPLRMPSFSSNRSFSHTDLDDLEDVILPRTTSALSSLGLPPSSSPSCLLQFPMVTTGGTGAGESLRYGGMDDSLIFKRGGTLHGPSQAPEEMLEGEEYQRLSDFSSMLADMRPAVIYR